MLTTDFVSALGMNMNYGVMDLVGNVGVVILMVTYLLLQLDKIKSAHLSYSVLNALSQPDSCSLVVNFNLSAMLMEVFWVLISFIGIGRHSVSKRSDPEPCTHRSKTLRRSRFLYLPNGAHAATWLTWPKDPETWPDRVSHVEQIYLEMIAARRMKPLTCWSTTKRRNKQCESDARFRPPPTSAFIAYKPSIPGSATMVQTF